MAKEFQYVENKKCDECNETEGVAWVPHMGQHLCTSHMSEANICSSCGKSVFGEHKWFMDSRCIACEIEDGGINNLIGVMVRNGASHKEAKEICRHELHCIIKGNQKVGYSI